VGKTFKSLRGTFAENLRSAATATSVVVQLDAANSAPFAATAGSVSAVTVGGVVADTFDVDSVTDAEQAEGDGHEHFTGSLIPRQKLSRSSSACDRHS
jgi:hypothetical protein